MLCPKLFNFVETVVSLFSDLPTVAFSCSVYQTFIAVARSAPHALFERSPLSVKRLSQRTTFLNPNAIRSSPTQTQTKLCQSGFGGLEVVCWPLLPKFAGSSPAENFGFFRAKKILSTPSFGRKVKPFVPCRRFKECKRSLNVTWKSGIFRQNSSAISLPSSSSFHY